MPRKTIVKMWIEKDESYLHLLIGKKYIMVKLTIDPAFSVSDNGWLHPLSNNYMDNKYKVVPEIK